MTLTTKEYVIWINRMKKKINTCSGPLFLLILILFVSCEEGSIDERTCGLEERNDNSSVYYKILFIGNSHTYVNDIPNTIKFLAKSKGDSMYAEMSAPGGYEFQRHYTDESTLSAIRAQKWDYVVLQESGWRVALPDFMADTMVYPYADSLYAVIRTNNELTKIILYMTQGYRDGATWWCDGNPSVCTYEGMQEYVKGTYIRFSEQINAQIAPAGMIWMIYMDKYPNENLFNDDGYHANPLGSYISACTIYSVIFLKRPVGGYIPVGISEEEGSRIQTLVANVLFDCNPDWKEY
jgi:hypothetical protein